MVAKTEDVRLCKIFIQTPRGVIVCPVIADYHRHAWRRGGHRWRKGVKIDYPRFWVSWSNSPIYAQMFGRGRRQDWS